MISLSVSRPDGSSSDAWLYFVDTYTTSTVDSVGPNLLGPYSFYFPTSQLPAILALIEKGAWWFGNLWSNPGGGGTPIGEFGSTAARATKR